MLRALLVLREDLETVRDATELVFVSRRGSVRSERAAESWQKPIRPRLLPESIQLCLIYFQRAYSYVLSVVQTTSREHTVMSYL